MNLRSVGSCYLWCWGPAIPKSGQGPAFRVVSSYASALPEQLCACRLAPPCTRRERVTRPRGEDHEDLRAARQSLRVAGPGCLCRSTAQPLREPIAGARRRPELSEFSPTLANTSPSDADENATHCPGYASRACERLRRGGTLRRLACRLFRFGKGCPLCPG